MPESVSIETTQTPSVWISVVHWNGGDSTIACVESLFADGYQGTSVVVVDNASTDDAIERIRARWPQVAVVRNHDNAGFTGGHNRGIAHARAEGADFIVLLNQDALVKPGCIRAMVELACAEPRVGLISPVVYFEDRTDRIQFSGSWIDRRRLDIAHSYDFEAVRSQERSDPAAMCLWGTAMMIRAKVIDEIGVLDDRFFAYYEDSDYSARASKAGWLNRMCFAAAILHEGHHSSYTRPPHFFYFIARNGILFWKKILPGFYFWPRIRIHVARSVFQAANFRDAGMPDHVQACLDGIWDGFRNRFGPRMMARHAPPVFNKLVMKRPFLLAALLNFEFSAIGREITSRITKRA